MYTLESILENETQTFHWDFEIQTDHLIPTKKANILMIKKKITYQIVDFAVQANI